MPRAADLPLFTLESVAGGRWAGFYAGAFTGAGVTRFTSYQTGSATVGKTGLINGSLIGWNTRLGDLVVGVKADLGLHIIRADNAGGPGLVAHGSDNLYSAHLRGRVGYDFGRFLPYVAGGATYKESYVRRASPNVYWGSNRINWGWNIGAGLDTQAELPFVGPSCCEANFYMKTFPARVMAFAPTSILCG